MERQSRPLIELNWDNFNPWRVQELQHDLAGHPLLQLERLVEFGQRLEGTPQVFTFNNAAKANVNFNAVARKFPNRKSVAETMLGAETAQAWMLLRHVQSDPAYRDLIDTVLDSVEQHIGRPDPGMYYRAGWIIVSSPRTVTPFHFDPNHGMLLQIRGSKMVYAWDRNDTHVASERARDRYHYRHSMDLLQWQDDFRERAHAFRVRPGTGVYLPLTSPHMVETSDEPSITITCSYNTRATRRCSLVHATHGLIRRTGIEPSPVGRHPLFDSLANAGAEALLGLGGEKILSVAGPDRQRARYMPVD